MHRGARAGFVLVLALLEAFATLAPARAGDRPGDFAYYVLSLEWSPSWCELTGDAHHDPQCAPGRGFSFTLHGLWPQYEQGYPSDCRTPMRDATRAQTAAMADIMGSAGLAWHEWLKHGRCSGLSAADYFATARNAYGEIAIPKLFTQVTHDLSVPARVIEAAFLAANPVLKPGEILVTCDAGRISEVRICLTRALAPRACGADLATSCPLNPERLPALR